MIHYPEVQQKARSQPGRMPAFEDRQNLRSVQAIIKETLR